MNKEVKELIEETEMIRDTFADDIFIHLLNRILDYINNSQEKINQLEDDNKRLLERLGQEVKRNIELSNMSRAELIKMINQLETNIDEAIELNKKINNLVAFGDSENKLPDLVWELSSILGRGKEWN